MRPAARVSAALLLLVATAAQAQVQLQPKQQEGKATTTTDFKLNQKLKIGGQEIPTTVDLKMVALTDAGKPGADGNIRIGTTTQKTLFKLELPGVSVDYDSAKPETATSAVPELQAALDALKAMVGATFTLVTNGKGEVQAVEGVDKMAKDLSPSAAQELRTQLALPKLKQEAAQELAVLPGKPVQKGDRWERKEVQDLGGGQSFTYQVFYEYQGEVEKDGKKVDKVGIFISDVKYAQDPNVPTPTRVTRSELKLGGSTGYYLFDRAAGAVVERSVNVTVNGTMTLDINGMELPANVDITLDTYIVTKR